MIYRVETLLFALPLLENQAQEFPFYGGDDLQAMTTATYEYRPRAVGVTVVGRGLIDSIFMRV